MKYGFVKVGAAIPTLRVADCKYNAEKIVELVLKAENEGVLALAFPELSVTGYSCGDLFLSNTLLCAAENAVSYIIENTKNVDVLLSVGVPFKFYNKLYDCAAVIFKGELLALMPKSNLASHGEYAENRYFNTFTGDNETVSYASQSCIFGDKIVFNHANLQELALSFELGDDTFAQLSPSTSHAMGGATVIMNMSASSECVGKPEMRRNLVKASSLTNRCAYVYASAGCGESTTDLIYSGHSFICELGDVIAENKPFGNSELVISEIDTFRISHERSKTSSFVCEKDAEYTYIEFDTGISETKLARKIDASPFIPKNRCDCEFILDMQAQSLARRVEHTRCKKLVLGISGGLDSTLAILVAVRAMNILKRPSSDVLAITMPCFGTGKRTKGNAEDLCEELNVDFRCIDIAASVKQHLDDIGHDMSTYDVAFENAQARERTQILMDVANSVGGIVLGTGDLSEAALGWATYNGDHMSMYNVNCNIPKTLVRYLVDYCADTTDDKKLTCTLKDILGTPVSPELIPTKEGELGQKTEEIVGDYSLHDFFVYYFVEHGYTPEKLLYVAKHCFAGTFDEEHIKKVLNIFINRFFTQQFKRSCSPDGVKVNAFSLSPRGAWRMPSDAFASEWLNEIK